MKGLLLVFSLLLPWPLRRLVLITFLGYEIHPTSRLGLVWVAPRKLILESHSRIGHFTVCKNLDLLQLGPHASIGRGNWITGFPSGDSEHFAAQKDRRPCLILGEHSAITHRHLIDCTNTVVIGDFSTIAGYGSQILTHSIDLEQCIQSSAPVAIGNYCFVGTSCVVLGGSVLPDYCVLGAKSLLNKQYSDTHCLYGGVPARPIKSLTEEALYFVRTVGFVT
ncbi:MAG: acyltransferase [Gemmatimonadaceae bacterium]|nr:acyltransferase [Gloeobacterales cyanobacterium ES-bin-141]